MSENSPEDTAWLAKETNDFLYSAIVWPNAMVKIFNVIALLCLSAFAYATVENEHMFSSVFIAILGGIAYKLYQYYADIRLIKNELNRRFRLRRDKAE